jgi:hypothetical protein
MWAPKECIERCCWCESYREMKDATEATDALFREHLEQEHGLVP